MLALALLAGVAFASVAVVSGTLAPSVAAAPAIGTGNWAGPAGDRAASSLIGLFGYGVWVLLLGLLAFDWRLLRRRPLPDPGLRLFGLLLQVAAVCAAVQWIAADVGEGPIVGNGGWVGAVTSLLLRQHFSGFGATTLIVTTLLVGGVLAGEHGLLRMLTRSAWRVGLAVGSLTLLPLTALTALGRRRAERRRVQVEARAIADELDANADAGVAAAEGGAEGGEAEDQSEGRDEPAVSGYRLRGGAGEPPFEADDVEEVCDADAVDEPNRAGFKVNPPAGSGRDASEPVRFEGLATRRQHSLPALDLLDDSEPFPFEELSARAQEAAVKIEETFTQFGLNVKVTEIDTGPVVTQFELDLEPGLSVKKIANLVDDLAIALRVPSVRLVSPIPGRNTVGVEVPNRRRVMVRMRELMEGAAGESDEMKLPLFLGKDVSGQMLNVDLADMPHLLIAGRTGTGKSVCLNTLIVSLLMTRTPDEVRMLMIDPKMVELSPYKSVPHLMHPVITDMKKAEAVLAWACDKMDERYELLAGVGVRHLSSYNKLGKDEVLRRLEVDPDDEAADEIPETMPSIVIVADEMADLMMTCGQDVQTHIIRLAQKARAVGIHLVLATQKPTVDVVTSLIKSNLPARISFQVASKTDSRVVLDENGAESLLGKGDMLYLAPGTSTLTRAQGTFVSDDEVMAVIDHFAGCEPQFSDELKEVTSGAGGGGKGLEAVKDRDDLYRQAVELVISEQLGSISLLQRHLSVGYGRAGKMIDHMFEDGIVGDRNGAKPREVLFTMEDWEDFVAENGLD